MIVGDTVGGADDGGQGLGVDLGQGGRPKAYLVGGEFGTRRHVHPEGLLEQGADPVGQRLGRRRVAPRVPRHRGHELVVIAESCVTVLHMLSISNADARPPVEDRILEAAASAYSPTASTG